GNAVAGFGLEAEVAIELRVRHGAQHVLVEDWDLAPFGGLAEAVEVDVVELAAKERRAFRLRDRVALAPGVDARDGVRVGGRRQRGDEGAHGRSGLRAARLPIQHSWRL